MGVHPLCFGIRHVRMASFTSLVARIDDGVRGDFRKCVPAKVPIAPEAFGNERAAENEKENQAEGKDRSHAEEMRDILQLHHGAPDSRKSNERSFFNA